MKRNLLIANIVVISAFFLVFLGMRNISLDQTRGPKPRPRALIENVNKAPLALSCEQQVDAVLCAPTAVTPTFEAKSFYRLPVSSPPSLTRPFLPSRASPSLPPRLA